MNTILDVIDFMINKTQTFYSLENSAVLSQSALIDLKTLIRENKIKPTFTIYWYVDSQISVISSCPDFERKVIDRNSLYKIVKDINGNYSISEIDKK